MEACSHSTLEARNSAGEEERDCFLRICDSWMPLRLALTTSSSHPGGRDMKPATRVADKDNLGWGYMTDTQLEMGSF